MKNKKCKEKGKNRENRGAHNIKEDELNEGRARKKWQENLK